MSYDFRTNKKRKKFQNSRKILRIFSLTNDNISPNFQYFFLFSSPKNRITHTTGCLATSFTDKIYISTCNRGKIGTLGDVTAH